MTEPVCLKLKDYDDRYICNNSYVIQKFKFTYEGQYETITDSIIKNMEDLIRYCLTYNYAIDIPDGYNVTKLYHIVFSTGNFEPKDRIHTFIRSSITFTSKNKNQVEKMFKRMCKTIGRKPHYQDKFTYCWQGEDFAVNQIVNSYSITESYLVERNTSEKEDYKKQVLEYVKDIRGLCRQDVLNDLIKQIRSL